jgi:hypothetical protein
VATTEDHPFWNHTDGQWQRADVLDPGDLLLTADGTTVTVGGLDWGSVRTATAYNLSVDDIHTYFVAVGDNEVLVHNTNTCASNGTPSAAPSAFTRTEALAGRASTRTVNELAESMGGSGWQGAPIKVVVHNGQLLIVDGHHRVAAARIAGIDVPYQIVDSSSVIDPGQWSSLDDLLRDSYGVGPDRIRPR